MDPHLFIKRITSNPGFSVKSSGNSIVDPDKGNCEKLYQLPGELITFGQQRIAKPGGLRPVIEIFLAVAVPLDPL